MSTTTPAGRRLSPNLPIILLLAVNLMVGLLTFRDIGVAWDEPLYYAYGENVPYAYSISARLSGNFDILRSFEPSVEDHKRYGPAYLLAGRPLAGLIANLFNTFKSDGWHLVNFLSLQVSVWLVYLLARRWVSPWAAVGAAALFATQPVLWGHGFINPKDTPFSMLMLASLVSGMALVDRICALTPPAQVSETALPPDLSVLIVQRETRWQQGRRKFLRIALALILLALLLALLAQPLQTLAGRLVDSAYHAAPETLLGRVFTRLAPNAAQVGVAAYQAKAVIQLDWLLSVPVVAALLVLPFFLWLMFAPRSSRRVFGWLAATLVPLPARAVWWARGTPLKALLVPLLLAGALLGIATTLRILAPLAGLLVLLYFALRHERRSLAPMVAYALVALLFMVIFFPYLWDNPLARFIDVLRYMSDNPASVPVIFNGAYYPSLKLPRIYLPEMLAITLSEPVWLLFLAGLALAVRRVAHRAADWRALAVVLLLFVLPLVYVLVMTPAMYDGYRHFLFLLPPVFVLTGFAFQALLDALKKRWLVALALSLMLAPGIAGLISSHPYEYTYYNSLVGGTDGAFRRFDTDYWLTCYRDALDQINAGEAGEVKLYVHRSPLTASEYATDRVEVLPYDPDQTVPEPGSLVLFTTRGDTDQHFLPDLPVAYQVDHGRATFCVVRRVP